MIHITNRIKCFTLWLTLALAGVGPSTLWAQSVEDLLPAKFKLVDNLDEMVPDGYYLIGAEYKVTDAGVNEGFCLLTDLDGKNTLFGVESVYPVAPALKVTNSHRIWQLKCNQDGSFSLYSPARKKGVAKGKSNSGLVMKETGWISWLLQTMGNGEFCMLSTSDEDRALGLNWGREAVFFGNYKKNSTLAFNLRVYKMIEGGVALPGEAVSPADGSSLALVLGDSVVVRGKENWTFDTTASYLLQNKTLAFDCSFAKWTCKKENANFVLRDEEGRGLDWLLPSVPENMSWTIDNGFLASVELPRRYLVYDADYNLRFESADSLKDIPVKAVQLVALGLPADSITSSSGVKTLTGSWSAGSLANVDWEGVTALDLTNLALPTSALPFKYVPNKSNALLYIAERGRDFCPREWNHVVFCDDGGKCTLSDQFLLNDYEKWSIDREVCVTDSQVSYHRKAFADGFWETLCLPFDAPVPSSFHAERCVGYSKEDNVVIFEETHDIVANEPVIFRYVGTEEGENVDFVVYSKDGMLLPVKQNGDIFLGNYSSWDITGNEDMGIYFMNGEGTSFTKVAAKSHLSPFRAYLMKEKNEKVWNVLHKSDITGVDRCKMDIVGESCYTLEGRLISSALTYRQFELLPHGVYLIGKRKILK